MAEPSTVAGICMATAATAGVCTLAGWQADLMVLGLFTAALVTYIHPQIKGRGRSFAAVLIAASLATYAPPFVALVAAKRLADGQVVEGLAQTMALLIGVIVPPLLVPFLRRLKREADGGPTT